MDPSPLSDSPVDDAPGPDVLSDSLPDARSVDLTSVDLDRVERDLDDVQAALVRLNDGAYWTDEITGDELPAQLLADNPTARTVTTAN